MRTPAAKPIRRADYGASIDGFIARQPPPQREILQVLCGLIEKTAPGVQGAIKWGMPFFTLQGQMMCALGSHKAHVNLILVGPPKEFVDQKNRLAGSGKGGRHLKLTTIEELPRGAVRSWLRVAAKSARKTAARKRKKKVTE